MSVNWANEKVIENYIREANQKQCIPRFSAFVEIHKPFIKQNGNGIRYWKSEFKKIAEKIEIYVLLDSDNVDWSKIINKTTSKKLDTISFIHNYQYQDDSKNPLIIGHFNLSQKFLAYKKDSLKLLLNIPL
jgi:hypothetical protein